MGQKKILIVLFLITINLIVFAQIWNHESINYDDPDYVSDNFFVRSGLTYQGLIWAFETKYHGHWHPLTWLSHMTDCQFFGMNFGAHHLVSLAWHIINTLLLFYLLNLMTRTFFRSAFVAALFAVHSLNVECVAWIADRKDLLCAFFWIMTLIAYVCYCKRPDLIRYLTVLVLFCFGIMSKSMIITLPCILLLIDFWPLARIKNSIFSIPPNQLLEKKSQQPIQRLILEKVPFFILTFISIFWTSSSLQGKKIEEIEISTLGTSTNFVGESIYTYCTYIYKLFWPLDLILPYKTIPPLPMWHIIGAAAMLLLLTGFFLAKYKSYPYLIFGWLWYGISLSPVSGVVKFGPHIIADRYG